MLPGPKAKVQIPGFMSGNIRSISHMLRMASLCASKIV